MIHQHFMLVENQTVTENILIGLDTPRFALNLKKYDQEVSDLADQFDIHINPTAKIWQLSVGEQQRVEILKILYRGANILILDEPTAVLAPQEIDELIETLKEMAAKGKSIAFISHKLTEVKQVADKLTVLRRGRVTAERVDLKDFTRESLASLMVGREVIFNLHKCVQDHGREVMRLEDVSAVNNKNLPALRNVDLSLHEGEILGIAGVAGNGQSELVEVITGLRECTGKIWMDGKDIANKPPSFAISHGLAHIPEDRIGVGSAPNLSLTSNVIMKRYDKEPISHKWQLDYLAADELTDNLKTEYDIQAPSVKTAARKLSGGNLQKLILARELSSAPHLIVAMQPTRGLDVGAIEGVQQLLLRQREMGCAILLVSEDLDDILALSDPVAVMHEGHVVGVVCSDYFDITKIGLMMTGTLPQDLPETVKPELHAEGASSRFDQVLEAVRDYEAPPQPDPTIQVESIEHPQSVTPEESEQAEPPTPLEDPDASLSEKERVLRKILGENYDRRGEE